MEALTRHYASWVEAYPDLRLQVDEAKANGDTVFLWVHFSGHGAQSGIAMEMDVGHGIAMRDGKATRLVEYMDKAEALQGAGPAD